MPTVVRPPRVHVRRGKTFGLRLMSDLHVGSSCADEKRIEADVAAAVDAGDYLVVNGDVIDGVLPKDLKRYQPDTVPLSMACRNDLLRAQIDRAVALLKPAASAGLLAMVGAGNHEDAVLSHHAIDPTAEICAGLGGVPNGGYTGFIVLTFPLPYQRYLVYYHHGAAKVRQNKIPVWADADLYWCGHHHSPISTGFRRLRCPTHGDTVSASDVRVVQTGSYLDAHRGQTQAERLKSGRRTPYPVMRGYGPECLGSARVEFHFLGQRRRQGVVSAEYHVTVTQ